MLEKIWHCSVRVRNLGNSCIGVTGKYSRNCIHHSSMHHCVIGRVCGICPTWAGVEFSEYALCFKIGRILIND
jgi:hypothetical protein